jgi:uncharacterized membrane protein YqjE
MRNNSQFEALQLTTANNSPVPIASYRQQSSDDRQMLKSATDPETRSRPEITQLIDRLLTDGRRWASAEAEVAKLELADLKSRAIRAVIFAILAFAAALCALVALSQAGIAFLAPVVGSVGLAALAVAGLLLVVVAVCVFVMRSALSWRTGSIFFRWFTRRPSAGA